ncbi:hypothetical protein PBRA_004528 [Plasmodiophora brassicae]|nr:hypothetical protein PBRA_004528 [Plasmodiophora brassicae]
MTPKRIEGQLDLVHWETVRTGSSGHASARHVVSGGRFRPLDGPDISKEIEALDDEDGELTGACLRDWLKSYHDESTMFTSLAVYIEIKMREVRHATRNVPMPNAFRTAVCCDMMRKLATCMGGFRDAFEMISLEIYRSIYRDYQPGTFDVFQGTPFYVETRHMKKVADDKQNEIARLQNEIEIRKARAETAVANLDKIVNKWSSSILVSSFRQWRMYVGGRKDKFKRLSKYFRKSNMQKELFLRWKAVTTKSLGVKLRALQARHREMQQQLEARVEALVEERDVQKQSLVAIAGRLAVSEADNEALRGQLAMSTDEVVSNMKTAMAAFQVEYFRFTIAAIGERLRAAREELVATFQSEALCDAFMLLAPGEETFSEANLLALVPEDLVLRWVNHRLRHIKDERVRPVDDLSISFQSGTTLIFLLNLAAPTVITLHSLEDPDPRERLRDALAAAADVGANDGPLAVTADVFENKADLTFVLLARLMALFPGVHPRKQVINEELVALDATIHRWEKLRRSRKGKTPDELAAFSTSVNEAVTMVGDAVQKLHSRHRLWEAIVSKVAGMAMTMLAARMRGDPIVVNDARENMDLAQYRTIVRWKYEELVPQVLSAQEEIARVQVLLDKYAVANRKIFRHYAAAEGVGSTMSLNEFVKFVQDAKLVGKTLKMPQVERIFQLANSDASVEAEAPAAPDDAGAGAQAADDDDVIDDVENPDEELVPREFVECLVRLAVRKFAKPMSVADRLQMLMENYVLKNAMRSERFREDICSVKVRDVFDRYRSCLKCIFRYYASGGKNPKKSERREKSWIKDDTISMTNFHLLVKECAWVDATFSLSHVGVIFNNIQRMEEDEAADVHTELVYDEFIEGLAAIAVMKIPNPYVELDTRIEDFITTRLLTPLGKLNHITGLKKLVHKVKGSKATSKEA